MTQLDAHSTWFVRNEAELRSALVDGGAERFLCANLTTMESCAARSLSAEVVDEDRLAPEAVIRELNWLAMKKALELVERLEEDSPERLFFQSHFMSAQALILQPIKYALSLDALIEKKGLRLLTVFDDQRSLWVPSCLEYARRLNEDLRVRVLPAPQPQGPSFAAASVGAARRVLGRLASASRRDALRTRLDRRRRLIFVSGALRHLAPVLERFTPEERKRTAYCENAFNYEKFMFCVSRGIDFLVLPSGIRSPLFLKTPIEGYFRSDEILMNGTDYSAYVSAVMGRALERGAARFDFDPSAARDFLINHPIEMVLLDEDIAARRIFFSLAEKMGIPTFVVSHGVPGMPLSEAHSNELAGRYPSATVFVNSEFEKRMYESVGYQSSKLIMTGTPRYDAIFRMSQSNRPSRPSSKKRQILYCGAGMQDHDFEEWLPWLGLKNFCRDYAGGYIRDLLSIAREHKDLHIIIKPHYADEKKWKTLVSSFAEDVDCKVASHRDDTFRLIADADLVVTVESTVICEAIMLDKPVILLNYTTNDFIVPYDRSGLVLVARSADELTSAMRDILQDEFYQEHHSRLRTQRLQYYTGVLNGCNAQNVVNSLRSISASRSTVPGLLVPGARSTSRANDRSAAGGGIR